MSRQWKLLCYNILMKRNSKYYLGAFLVCVLAVSACTRGASSNRGVAPEGDSGTVHNSRDSLDWAGTYAGLTPSASGMGIEVRLTLNGDGTYELHYSYVGRAEADFMSTGNFTWDDAGSVITLDLDSGPCYYQMGENMLRQLDLEGQEITGDLADMYILRKE